MITSTSSGDGVYVFITNTPKSCYICVTVVSQLVKRCERHEGGEAARLDRIFHRW